MKPHKSKLDAALRNPKCKKEDIDLLTEASAAYDAWSKKLLKLSTKGKDRINDMVGLLNEYKDYLEVELIAERGSEFLKRQKGQLKLDNSILEEFLIDIVNPDIIEGLPTGFSIEKGPQNAFMSMSFTPSNINALNAKPEIAIKSKDQDFTIGKSIFYNFSPDNSFAKQVTNSGKIYLSALSAEIKVNYDKTMFQECAGTAARLKQGCPMSKYYVLVEYLDMQPEDCRLTDIDNVFLLRKAKRLPSDKRGNKALVKQHHKDFPICPEVFMAFVNEVQGFVKATWYDPDAALSRGSFV